MENIQELVDRLIQFHKIQGVPYSFISERIGMNPNTMRAIVTGRAQLKEEYVKRLNEYLRLRGF